MHVTDSACEVLSGLLGRRAAPDRCLRLSTVQGNYRFIIDEPIEQDITFHYEERLVLVVSETVSRDLWGITVDCNVTDEGKRKLIFRKAKQGEPFDVIKDDADVVPPEWRASEHERLLSEIKELEKKRTECLRGGSKSALREQLQTLDAQKQEKWDAIRTLWAGDGGWHRRNGAAGGSTTSMPAKQAD